MRRAVLLLLLPALLGLPVSPHTRAAEPRAFRLIAFDYRQTLDAAASYGSYAASLREQVLAAKPAFRSDAPTLAVLPEDTGLMAWLVGPRGALGRLAARAGHNSAAAVAALAPAYAGPTAYYQAKCTRISPTRALILGLSDTAWRAFGETLAALAHEQGIWILANLNGPDLTVTRDPARVALLGDPAEVANGYAYEGGCEPHNRAVLFRPDGTLDPDGAADPARVLGGAQRKVYLVPIERDQTVGLGLASESPANARVIATPFARLGVLTSKDAWMPDVVERLEIDGMDVFVQPEAGEWAGAAQAEGGWPPDAMTRAVWSMVQWQAETSVGALANLTGNFGDLYFDGTATVTRDATPGETPTRFLLGRLPQAGIAARAPWVFADPPAGVALADVPARRAALQASGARLFPGSGDPLENDQLANFVSADISLPALGPVGSRLTPAGGASVSVAGGLGAQWSPQLAPAPGGGLLAAWTDLRDGFEQPYVARSADGGRAWAPPVRAGDRTARPFDQQDNQYDARLAVGSDGGAHLVWVDFRNQSWDVYGSRSIDGGGTWAASTRVDHSPSSAEGFPAENLSQDPAVATLPDARLVAVWADARGTRVDHGIVAARSTDGGVTWTGDESVDGSGSAFAEQWSPVLAVSPGGMVLAAWQDQRAGINRIYASRSSDGGATWTPAVAVAPSSADQWQPAVAAGPSGEFAVAWSEGVGGSARRVRLAILGPKGAARVTNVDRGAPAGVRQARPAVAFAGTTVWVAWQDDRAGDWDVLAAPIARGRRPGAVRRVDDGPAGTDARLPAIAWTGAGPAVAWEDTRGGPEQVRAAVL